jgi:glutaredoxin
VHLTLYGRRYCHLCEDMERALGPLQDELGFTLEVVDVDHDVALERKYGERVPVLAGPDGREICHHFLDARALAERLAVK